MMTNFVGIDLGTTNSAIASYDGQETRIWKSPEQNDVTPSAIFIDRRGNKYVGKRAYDSAPNSPDNAALLFKRVMGTSTPIEFPGVGVTKSPEECSSEILQTLFGYLPEELRVDGDTGAVITVPAAFNQMQKDATRQAAELAGIGAVALMQEPVAAVMSVMRIRETDGIFVIYDLGGGTLDVAIAESIGGRVSLLAHGGIAMCGGRDFDRLLMDNIVKPWIDDKFDLPQGFSADPRYKSLLRLSAWAVEKAKVELSSGEETIVSLSETEARCRDQAGEEIYLDIPLSRAELDDLIGSRVDESIVSVRETLKEAGLTHSDIECVTFVGGPTHYKPLRDRVTQELGIPAGAGVNPMTAVAEGASIFAESIDWSTQTRSRKASRGQIRSGGSVDVSFNYIARTPDSSAKVAVKISGDVPSGAEFQIDSLETGWTSGRQALTNGATIALTLPTRGENVFKAFVFDGSGSPIALEQNRITITRTAATVDSIPASYSIGMEAKEKINGQPVLDWLVRAGDSLPKKGQKIFRAEHSLKAGSDGSLNLKLWEGEIEDPISDNRFVGILKITGHDFSDGVIAAGDELICEYEVQDSGNIDIEVSVPSIGGTFPSGHNFYSRQEGQIDFTKAAALVSEESKEAETRLEEIESVVDDPNISRAREKLHSASLLDENETDPETSKQAMDNVLEAKRILATIRKDNLQEIRQIELDKTIAFFDEAIREMARPSEVTAFDSLVKTAQRSIERGGSDFETQLGQLRGKMFEILWRQDWFVTERFKSLISSPHLFTDMNRYRELKALGLECLQNDDIDRLRQVCYEMSTIRVESGGANEMFDAVNIVRG
jgi:molecular chaperone DnaK